MSFTRIVKYTLAAFSMTATVPLGLVPAHAQWGGRAVAASPYYGYYGGTIPRAVVVVPVPVYEYDVTPYYYRAPGSSLSYQYGWHDPAGCGPGKPIC
jgi:hypothetical protein